MADYREQSTDASVEPFGALSVNPGYATLLYDSWSVSPIDTTDKWTVTGTAPTIAGGNMQMSATVSTYNAIKSKDTVRPNVGYTLVRNGYILETSVATGAGRFFGLGTPANTPAPAVLVQDGIGFEVDQATGAFLAVTYANGVRTTVATLTRPSDGLNHGFSVYFRVTQAFWYIDSALVASQSFPNVQIVELPSLVVRQNASSFTGTPNFSNIAHITADTSRQPILISDPIIGLRQARVKAASTLPAATDSALVVTQRDALPAGTNTVGGVALVSAVSGGTALVPRPDAVLRVAMDPTSLLLDTFETLDTTNTWTTSGTVPPTASAGALTISAGILSNGTSVIRSQQAFTNGATAFLNWVSAYVIDAGAITGNTRVFGLGVPNATPTTSVPITNGCVFELQSSDGSMVCSTYSNGVRTVATAITRPSDGAAHRYAIYFRASRVYFEIDGVVVASTAFPNPQIDALPAVSISVNAAAGFPSVTAATLVAAVIGIGDTGRNNQQLSDATYPWRKSQIGKNGGLSVKSCSIPAISTNFAAAGTGIAGPVDVSEAGNVCFIVKNQIAATAFTGSPVLVFEQSDDNVSWSPLAVTRGDTLQTNTTFTITPPGASTEIVFNATATGIAYARARVTTGTTANGMTVSISGGGFLFAPQVSTVDRKDSGRTPVTLYVEALAGAVTEALITMSYSQALGTITTGTSFAVPAGKTLRLTSMMVSLVSTTTTANTAKIRIRANAAGTAVIGSNIVWSTPRIGWNSATYAANQTATYTIDFPDGYEFLGGSGVGFTHAEAAANGTVDVMVTGFLY